MTGIPRRTRALIGWSGASWELSRGLQLARRHFDSQSYIFETQKNAIFNDYIAPF